MVKGSMTMKEETHCHHFMDVSFQLANKVQFVDMSRKERNVFYLTINSTHLFTAIWHQTHGKES